MPSPGVIMSGGMQLPGFGQSSLFGSFFQNHSPSVYGGAGGYGTRISKSASSYGSMRPYIEWSLIPHEKDTMQNLNDRLASYLTKVRTLEAANKKLELQIREYYEKRAPSVSSDFTSFFATISDLRAQIQKRHLENERIRLVMDNAQLAADDFRMKYEMEKNLRLSVEADVARSRGVRDSITFSVSDLEMQIEGLKADLVYMKSNHEEEMILLRTQHTGKVNVEVDSTESVDLTKILEEMRQRYETVVRNNNIELEKWFKSQVDILITSCGKETTEVKTFQKELSELKRTYQSVEINRNSILTEIKYLQRNLEETNARYSFDLSQLQLRISTLEEQIQQKSDCEQEIRRLEQEIAEYRRLLEGEHYEVKKPVVISVEEHKPHIERRVKTIVEEIIDGKVVSSSVDTQVEDITTPLN
ncbi:Keratin, type I cytoskeletal 20 Cytokeratin-20 [Larimichthys crocea]|uniref:Keratin, type I cytoskeletal 20 Cytokeratin-20 n=1 Tax=Larimichthys crocea TaxID=215358 RepID=A0A6G0JB01_LARCR|nr:Keratin, type I cytoskeletal 20 Cytokeratin-20 [Larimichthys crocea]